MPMPYKPKDPLDPRRCIVCGEVFQPKRVTQVFSPSPDCWHALVAKEGLLTMEKAHAIVLQERRCHFCGVEFTKPPSLVLLDPAQDILTVRQADVVVAHTACRISYYRDLSERPRSEASA